MLRPTMVALAILLVAGFGLMPSSTLAQSTSVDSDRAVLIALYNATGGPNWEDNTNWLSDHPIGEWFGVTTNASGRVVRLQLGSNGLFGQIAPDLGQLSELQVLELHENRLSGSIPPTLGSLSNLTDLWLHADLLGGQIPAELGDLARLRTLILTLNRLRGQIPPQLGNLSALTSLGLASNMLTGPVPPELGNLSELQELSLGNNMVSGDIPPELGNLSNLIHLRLQNTQLAGCIPEGLRQVASNDFDRVGLPLCDELSTTTPTPDAFDEALNSLRVPATRSPSPTPAPARETSSSTFTRAPSPTTATAPSPAPVPVAGPAVTSASTPTPAPQRGFFTNSVPSPGGVEADLPFDIMDPVTLSLIGVLVTLGATAIQLFRGK